MSKPAATWQPIDKLTPTVFKDSILVTGLTKVYQYGFGN